MGERGLVDELGLALEPDTVVDLMVSHSMLQDHDFQHFLGLGVREFTLGDEGISMGR